MTLFIPLTPPSQATTASDDALWLNVSPALQRLDGKLLKCLARHYNLSHWSYRQTCDEPSSLEIALTLLQDYLKVKNRPIHLFGHGIGGLLGLLYARRFPGRVKSLTLISVGVNPMVDWQAHYYTRLEKLPCSRYQVLTQMAYSLFGYQAKPLIHGWINLLEADLASSPSPHSLLRRVSLFPGKVPVPLMVCGGQDDAIVDPTQIYGWRPWLKPEDRLWICRHGRYFFHHDFPQQVASQILSFWETTAPPPVEMAYREATG